VTGVLKLLEETDLRVLYLDIDIHHGDAVQDAFYYTDKVLFLDFHRFDAGFFPGTGAVSEIGAGTGKYYSKRYARRPPFDTCHSHQRAAARGCERQAVRAPVQDRR
jgi:hypothetical protein